MHTVDHSENIIELENISFSYNGEEVLKDVSFAIHKGDYFGVIGPNGGGKTTLLKLILGLATASKGSIRLFGEDMRRFKDWSKIGYVPQKATHIERNFPVTVEEVVAMGLYRKGGFFNRSITDDSQSVQQALEQVGMESFSRRLIGDLSGGQQQRVFIARALVNKPEVILLDEPTTGVDPESQENFYELLRNLNVQSELTLVLVSHDTDIIRKEATEIAVVHKTLEYHKNY